jgi:hypothetical protein
MNTNVLFDENYNFKSWTHDMNIDLLSYYPNGYVLNNPVGWDITKFLSGRYTVNYSNGTVTITQYIKPN